MAIQKHFPSSRFDIGRRGPVVQVYAVAKGDRRRQLPSPDRAAPLAQVCLAGRRDPVLLRVAGGDGSERDRERATGHARRIQGGVLEARLLVGAVNRKDAARLGAHAAYSLVRHREVHCGDGGQGTHENGAKKVAAAMSEGAGGSVQGETTVMPGLESYRVQCFIYLI
jgi:hypothetical protein